MKLLKLIRNTSHYTIQLKYFTHEMRAIPFSSSAQSRKKREVEKKFPYYIDVAVKTPQDMTQTHDK